MITRLLLFASLTGLVALAFQEPDRQPSKVFQWVDQRSGDCHLSGVLTLHADGRARWEATTWTDSTHNKDYWNETLRVHNSQNQELFGFGVWDSPPMDSPPNGGQYRWSAEGRFSPRFFDVVSTTTSEGHL
jgi:hypothetical protein